MTGTPFLWTADNPHAPVRANGRRFWGYPTRQGGTGAIRCVVVHTFELDATPTSAEQGARWLRDAAPQPAAYHRLVDSDSTVLLLPDEAVAFGAANFNTPSLHLSFATRAAAWGKDPAWDVAALERGAVEAAGWVRRWGIPARALAASQARDGTTRGFVRHGDLQANRTDPGARFPYVQWLRRVAELADHINPKPDPPKLEDDVYVVRSTDRGPRVRRAQRVLQAAGLKATGNDLLPRHGANGDYNQETAAAVNTMAARAGLPQDGGIGMDVLVLDYCRNWLSG